MVAKKEIIVQSNSGLQQCPYCRQLARYNAPCIVHRCSSVRVHFRNAAQTRQGRAKSSIGAEYESRKEKESQGWMEQDDRSQNVFLEFFAYIFGQSLRVDA